MVVKTEYDDSVQNFQKLSIYSNHLVVSYGPFQSFLIAFFSKPKNMLIAPIKEVSKQWKEKKLSKPG